MRNTKRGEIESVSDDRINHLTAKKERENALEMDEVRQMLSVEYFKYFNSNLKTTVFTLIERKGLETDLSLKNAIQVGQVSRIMRQYTAPLLSFVTSA